MKNVLLSQQKTSDWVFCMKYVFSHSQMNTEGWLLWYMPPKNNSNWTDSKKILIYRTKLNNKLYIISWRAMDTLFDLLCAHQVINNFFLKRTDPDSACKLFLWNRLICSRRQSWYETFLLCPWEKVFKGKKFLDSNFPLWNILKL